MSVVALGTWEHKEVFWNTQTSDVCWRVPDVRETIIAKPGNVILSSDYSQIEIKIMAFLSQDPGLIAAINSGKDIHSYIATDVFGATLNFDYDLMIKAIKDSTHPRNVELTAIRSRTKTTSFGIPYGAGPTKVALMTGLSLEEAQELIDVYLGRYPLLKAWLKEMGDNAINLGYSQSAGGRKRFYDIPELDNPDGVATNLSRRLVPTCLSGLSS
jgi:DNA polymerase-1